MMRNVWRSTCCIAKKLLRLQQCHSLKSPNLATTCNLPGFHMRHLSQGLKVLDGSRSDAPIIDQRSSDFIYHVGGYLASYS